MSRLLQIGCALLCVFLFSAAHYRMWKDISGDFEVRATLVDVKEGHVLLEKAEDGQRISLAIEKLSRYDQRYVKFWLQRNRNGDGDGNGSGDGSGDSGRSPGDTTGAAVANIGFRPAVEIR